MIRVFCILLFGCIAPCPEMVFSIEKNIFSNVSDTSSLQRGKATLSCYSSPHGAKIFFDTVFLGITPIENAVVPGGVHVLRCVHPDSNNWVYSPIAETLNISGSDLLERNYIFPLIYYLSSKPTGAVVSIRDSIVGVTPCRLSLLNNKFLLKFSKDEFTDKLVLLPAEGNSMTIELESLRRINGGPVSPYLHLDQSNHSALYTAGGAAVMSGALAAYLKIKADKKYKQFQQTKEVGVLKSVERLDLISGISLAICEISLIFVSYLLFSK